MATPSVFVSSTFYDLRYIRESLKLFVSSLGYSPVLSEEGTVFYDPETSAAEACLAEVPNCQIFILVIGGRYGSELGDSGKSITNAEYQQAVHRRIPVFALVEQGVYNDYTFYKANSAHPEKLHELIFPHADNIKIFEFIDQVQRQAVNNALIPFHSFSDIEVYLRNQWAGMMFSFLTRESSEAQVVDALALMAQVNQRIELIAEQILRNVGSLMDRVAVTCLLRMLESQAVTDLRYIGASPTPADVIRHNGIAECAKAFGKKLNRTSTLGTLITESGLISDDRFKSSSEDYAVLRSGFLDLLGDNNIRPEDFMEYEFRPLVTEVPPANSKKASRQLPRKTASTPERANQ